MTKDEALDLALEALEQGLDEHFMKTNPLGYDAITAIKQARSAPVQEPVAWKNAAIRLGEELSSVGPDGYYDMTAEQWLDWAMNQQPRGKNSLPEAQRWAVFCGGCRKQWSVPYQHPGKSICTKCEAKLKELNT
jgi:hypothetical protein